MSNNTFNSNELDHFIQTEKIIELISKLNIKDDFLYTEDSATFHNSFSGLDEAIKNVRGKRKIGDYIYHLLEERRKKIDDIHLRAGISKEYWHRATTGKIHPSKKKLLCLAIILKLSLEDSEKLLRVAGYSLTTDLTNYEAILGYAIEKQIYSIIEIDEQLSKYGEKTIFSIE